MIHYTCDMCRKSIDTEADNRFRVLIDIEQMLPGEDDSDLEADLPGQLPFDEFELVPQNEDGLFRSFKFDLCRECVEAYLRDPLARKTPRRLRFMDN